VVRADLPGIKKATFYLEICDDQLSISGERNDEREEQKVEYYRAERTYGRFERKIHLPQGTDPDGIKCTFENGILEVRMKAPQAQRTAGRLKFRTRASPAERPDPLYRRRPSRPTAPSHGRPTLRNPYRFSWCLDISIRICSDSPRNEATV